MSGSISADDRFPASVAPGDPPPRPSGDPQIAKSSVSSLTSWTCLCSANDEIVFVEAFVSLVHIYKYTSKLPMGILKERISHEISRISCDQPLCFFSTSTLMSLLKMQFNLI